MLTRTDAFMYLMEVDKRLAERLGEQPLMDTALVAGGIAPERTTRVIDSEVIAGLEPHFRAAENEEWNEAFLVRVRGLAELEQDRQSVEDRISDLRQFERTYRQDLLEHLTQLQESAPDYVVQERIQVFLQILENPNGFPAWR